MNEILPAKRKGAPTKFTVTARRRFVRLVARGVPFTHACAGVGWSYQSFLNYREKHLAFKESLEKAVARAIDKRLSIIERAANMGDAASARWLLEHLHPEHFAKTRLEVTGADGSPLTAGIAVYLPAKDNGQPTVEVSPAKQIQNHERA